MTTPHSIGIHQGGSLPELTQVTRPSDAYELWDDYLESTTSLLEDLEIAALAYEQGLDLEQAAGTIRRILHKIKGESGMVGLDIVAQVCHETEYAFEEWPVEDRPDLLLMVKDWIQAALNHLI